MAVYKFIFILVAISTTGGCAGLAERGINDGSSMSRTVGTVLSGAAGALIGQQIGGNAESALLGGAIGAAAGAAATAPASSPPPATPVMSSPARAQPNSTNVCRTTTGLIVSPDYSRQYQMYVHDAASPVIARVGSSPHYGCVCTGPPYESSVGWICGTTNPTIPIR
jgi:hypothetical protein